MIKKMGNLVFISYSSEDKTVADAICHELEHHNIPCWIAPRDVQPGARFGAEIIRAISNCQLMVLVFSARSNMSDHVANEVDKAFNEGKTIIPFLIDNSKMNDEFEYYLSRKHWLAAYPHYKEHLTKLTTAVAHVLNISINNTIINPIKEELARQELQEAELELHINTDADCQMYCFGKYMKDLKVNSDNTIKLKPGTYKFDFKINGHPDTKQSLQYRALPNMVCDIIEVKTQELTIDENVELQGVMHEGLYGFENTKTQELVIPCKWTLAGDFSEGYAYVKNDKEKFGYINKKGTLIIPFKWKGAGNFSENLALVMDNNDKWGYIDRNGKQVILSQWEDAMSFCNGLARVQDEDSKWGFIDKTGNLVVPCEWEDAGDFCEGLARVQDEDSKWGFIDKTGNLVVPCEWEDAGDFCEGLARVQNEDLKWGFIDKTGNLVVPCEWEDAGDFCEGLARVQNEDLKWGFIDKEGKVVISCIWEEAEDFCKECAHVQDEDFNWGYINKMGEFSIDSSEYDFSEGLACIEKDGKYGFMDSTGKIIIPCMWDYAENFCDGFAQVVEISKRHFWGDEKWLYGFIDKSGRLITPCKWKYVEDFCEGFAEVTDEDGNNGFINENGEFYNPNNWGVSVYDFNEGLARVEGNNGKYGFIDKTGKLVIPCEWEDAEDFNEGLAHVEDKAGNEWIINKKGERKRVE